MIVNSQTNSFICNLNLGTIYILSLHKQKITELKYFKMAKILLFKPCFGLKYLL